MTRVPSRRGALLAAATAAALLDGAEAWACPSCFGRADGPLVDAARAGMWLLLGLTIALQAAFLAFFLYLRRQAARAEEGQLDLEGSGLQADWDRPARSGNA